MHYKKVDIATLLNCTDQKMNSRENDGDCDF
jgi:hypothetical protein